MTAILKLAYNDIPRRCSAISSNRTANTYYPVSNLFYGGSNLYWKNDANQTTTTFTFTVSSNFGTRQAEYLALRGANLLFNSGSGNVALALRGSTDNFVGSNVTLLSASGLTTANLVGPNLEDLIITGSLSSSYNYFAVDITTANSCIHALRKIYFGEFFTFGDTSPFYPHAPNLSDNSRGFIADNSALFKTSQGRKGRLYGFNWRAITDAQRNTWDKEIVRYANEYPVFLYQPAGSDHDPINAHTLVCGWIGSNVQSGEWLSLIHI